MNSPLASRRSFLQATSCSFGYTAFSALSTWAANTTPLNNPLAPKAPHFPAKAKRVIFLAMQGGPSHLDTFDYKPTLTKGTAQKGKIVAPVAPFRQHGQSGLWMSDLFPHLAEHADELCLMNGMHTDIPNHATAFVQLHTGSTQFVRPSLGAWALYGLGTENANLPGFITINPPMAQGGAQNFGSAFLPATYQGTRIGEGIKGAGKRAVSEMPTIGNIANTRLTPKLQREQLDLVQAMNSDLRAQSSNTSEIDGVIESYELAFRMQSEVPHVMDFEGESKATLKSYGIGETATDAFGKQCLMARRFAEAGVRFIEIGNQGWDHHSNLKERITASTKAIDQPIAALIADLKQRDMLKDTLIIWGGEFGRTPDGGNGDGRGHNAKGYTMWMAGGGVKGGIRHGATDDVGRTAVDGMVHIHDLHATVLALLGLNHEKLTYRYAGRDFRLTNVSGNVVHEIMA